MKKILLIIAIILCIFQLNVTATAWDVSTAVYSEKNASISEEDAPRSVTFNPDGDKMYIVGTSNDTVYQYTLSTPWDVSTAAYAEKSADVSEDGNNYESVFSSDGSKMYTIGYSNKTAYQYTLETPWDVSTSTYANKSVLVSDEETAVSGLAFNSDGTKMYMCGYNVDRVHQYTLDPAWDVSSATYDEASLLVSGQDTFPFSVFFNPDGNRMYIMGYNNDTVYQYTLETPWDIETAAYAEKSADVSNEEGTPCDVVLSSDGTKMYVVGIEEDTVFQYTLEENAIWFGICF